MDAAKIAARFSENQRSLVRDNLNGEDFTLLGCIESVAERLTKPSGARPALTEKRKGDDGWWHYRLTPAGVEVQMALAAQS